MQLQRRFYPFLACFIGAMLLLCSCGNTSGSTTTHVDGQAIAATSASSPTSTAPAVVGLGKDYAFIRNNQVWVALNGADPVQATHFTQIMENSNVFWGQMLWFDNDHFLVFTLSVLNSGLGGSGCSYQVRYMRFHALFVLNTSTMQMTLLTVPGEQALGPANDQGYWSANSLFREDDTHLLAWDGSSYPSSTSNSGGLYRYNFITNALTLVIPSANMPGANDSPIMYPMRYSNGQLFYETMMSVDNEGVTDYTIYSHSLTNPTQPSTKVLTVGRALYCPMNENPGDAAFAEPGWDISPDGTHIAVQTLAGSDMAHVTSQVQLVALQGGASTTIFQQVPSQVFNQDVTLTWGPDSQSLSLQGVIPSSTSSQEVLYTTNTTNASTFQSYVPSEYGYILWHTGNTAFALISSKQVYLFTVGQPESKLLLTNASYFAWGANQ